MRASETITIQCHHISSRGSTGMSPQAPALPSISGEAHPPERYFAHDAHLSLMPGGSGRLCACTLAGTRKGIAISSLVSFSVVTMLCFLWVRTRPPPGPSRAIRMAADMDGTNRPIEGCRPCRMKVPRPRDDVCLFLELSEDFAAQIRRSKNFVAATTTGTQEVDLERLALSQDTFVCQCT